MRTTIKVCLTILSLILYSCALRLPPFSFDQEPNYYSPFQTHGVYINPVSENSEELKSQYIIVFNANGTIYLGKWSGSNDAIEVQKNGGAVVLDNSHHPNNWGKYKVRQKSITFETYFQLDGPYVLSKGTAEVKNDTTLVVSFQNFPTGKEQIISDTFHFYYVGELPPTYIMP